jgi:hypothetical protein
MAHKKFSPRFWAKTVNLQKEKNAELLDVEESDR